MARISSQRVVRRRGGSAPSMSPTANRGAPGAGVSRGTGRGAPGARVNPVGMRQRGQTPDVFHNAINTAADVAGAFGRAGDAIRRGVSSAVTGFNARPQATGDQLKRALSDESTHALDNVLGKKRP